MENGENIITFIFLFSGRRPIFQGFWIVVSGRVKICWGPAKTLVTVDIQALYSSLSALVKWWSVSSGVTGFGQVPICVNDHIIIMLADLLFTICTAKLKNMPENTGFDNFHITLRKQTQHIKTSGMEKHHHVWTPIRVPCMYSSPHTIPRDMNLANPVKGPDEYSIRNTRKHSWQLRFLATRGWN